MKTFKQFIEQKNNFSNIINNIENMSKDTSKKINPESVANNVVNTVLDRLTGGSEGREETIGKIGKKFKKFETGLPSAVNKFNDFINSGKIESGIDKLGKKFSSKK